MDLFGFKSTYYKLFVNNLAIFFQYSKPLLLSCIFCNPYTVDILAKARCSY